MLLGSGFPTPPQGWFDAVFPHFVFDRAKPGIISVGREGRRFVNESTSYHRFVSAMYAVNKDGSHIPVYLVGVRGR